MRKQLAEYRREMKKRIRELEERVAGLEAWGGQEDDSLTRLYTRVERLEKSARVTGNWQQREKHESCYYAPTCQRAYTCVGCPWLRPLVTLKTSAITWGDNGTGARSAGSNDAEWSYSYGRDLNSSDAG